MRPPAPSLADIDDALALVWPAAWAGLVAFLVVAGRAWLFWPLPDMPRQCGPQDMFVAMLWLDAVNALLTPAGVACAVAAIVAGARPAAGSAIARAWFATGVAVAGALFVDFVTRFGPLGRFDRFGRVGLPLTFVWALAVPLLLAWCALGVAALRAPRGPRGHEVRSAAVVVAFLAGGATLVGPQVWDATLVVPVELAAALTACGVGIILSVGLRARIPSPSPSPIPIPTPIPSPSPRPT